LTTGLEAKWFGLLQELVPPSATIAVLTNPTNYAQPQTQLKDVQEAARAAARSIHVLRASAERDLEASFATLGQLKSSRCLSLRTRG